MDKLDERGIKYSSFDNVADLKNNLLLQCVELRWFLAYCIIGWRKIYIPLKYYEIMACEALHDIKEHIDNVCREIPCHMNEVKTWY